MSSEAFPSLISELLSSKCDGDRAKTKVRFEDQCQVVNTKLNHLVNSRSTDLSEVVAWTSKAIDVVASSKAKCRLLKNRLMSCRETLQCKREDLRRLWSESLQHKYAIQILEEIGELKKIPATVNASLLDKKYHHATQVLVSSIEQLEGKLAGIEALKELKVELHRLVDKLYAIFLEELIQELYMSTFHSVYQGSYDDSHKDAIYEKVFNYQPLKDCSKSINFNVSYVTVLLECMAMMGKIPETMEILKEECQSELMKIVEKLSKLMYDIVQGSTDAALLELPVSQGHRFLADLLDTIIGHFRQISINNKIFLHLLSKAIDSTGLEESYFEVVDLYSNMQTAIEQFVTSYLELQPMNSLPRQHISVFSNSQCGSDLSEYFLPKHYTEGRCQSLFKFRDSSQGLTSNRKKANYDHLQKSKESQLKDSTVERNSRKLVLVCKPSLNNITVLFDPIKCFALEIENTLEVDPGMHCPLYVFIYDCANNFLDQVNSEINRILENVSMSLESWNVTTVLNDTSPDAVAGSEKQILSSTFILDEKLKEMKMLLNKLPAFSNHFLQLMYYVIFDYKDLVQKAFKSLFDVEQNILSVSWAKDRDIRRLLKSFSNWKFLEVSETGEAIESPEDIRMRNKEESELLIRNLHSEEHSSWEIIRDPTILFNMAVLQESLQWFSSQLLTFVKDFKPTEDAEISLQLDSVNAAQGLQKLVKEYEDFSDVCLLALHLEVRAHCFHHLMQFEEVDIDVCAKNLAEDLEKIDEILVPALTSKELKYIFEGVGELVASILIHNVSNMVQLTESFEKHMHRGIFVVHCCLASITMTREVSLERVRQYVQLLNATSEEVLNEILEEGPKFKENEYSAILRLILEKEGASSHVLSDSVEKLQKIFRRAFASAQA